MPSLTRNSPTGEVEVQVQDASNTLLPSIVSNQAYLNLLTKRKNGMGLVLTVQSQTLDEQLDPDFLNLPNTPKLPTPEEMLSYLNAPPSEPCPFKTPPSPKQVNLLESKAEENVVMKRGNIPEHGEDIYKRPNLSLAMNRLRFRSPPPVFANYRSTASIQNDDDDDSLMNLIDPLSEDTSPLSRTGILKRHQNVNAKIIKKRKPFEKSRKERLVGSNAPLVFNAHCTREARESKLLKQKRKQRRERAVKLGKSSMNKKKPRKGNHYVRSSATPGYDATAYNSETEAPGDNNIGHLSSIKAAFLAKVKTNWDEVIRLYLDGKLEQIKHRQVDTNTNHLNNSGHKSTSTPQGMEFFRSMEAFRSNARTHIQNLMFPNHSKGITVRVPWKTLGIWLYIEKKRFINWDKNIPFVKFDSMFISHLRVRQLQDMLLIDLVDWSKDEVNFGTDQIPLVLDQNGRVLVKVGDLPRLYSGYTTILEQPVLRNPDEESITGSQYETRSSTSSSSSASNSSSVLSRVKRKRRTRSSKKRIAIAGLDGDSDSDSTSEDEGSSYETEDTESDHIKRIVKTNKRCKRVYQPELM
ncbi:hypothetical protein Clacol_008574 [Clathrus columnatus]|uniref:Uncharacterized protein n=1 Tax=Clathrus columnatus TaxID=1419009 RepID=A0AAV5AIX4_9AGAM|nr:hypothetical protein Clacol_008574 [Clathrus columnatus]